MKVVVTGTRGIPNILGGVETHCEELFPRMVQKDIDITIVRRKSYVHDSLAEYQGVKLVDITTPKKKSLEAVIHTFKAILKARSLHADIVHIHAIGPALLTPLARLLGMQVVFTHHGPDYDRDKWGVAAKTMLKLGERMGVMFANEVIVISEVIMIFWCANMDGETVVLFTMECLRLIKLQIRIIWRVWVWNLISMYLPWDVLCPKRIFII